MRQESLDVDVGEAEHGWSYYQDRDGFEMGPGWRSGIFGIWMEVRRHLDGGEM